jgi:hypothetical protein
MPPIFQAVEPGCGISWICACDEAGIRRGIKVSEDKKFIICMKFEKPAAKHLPEGRTAVEESIYSNQLRSRFELM